MWLRFKAWFRAKVLAFALWLIARYRLESDAAATLAQFNARMKHDDEFDLQQELATIYSTGFVTGLNSRGVPQDLLLTGKTPLQDASWEELDSIMQTAGRGHFMTRHIPVRPPSGKLR